MSQPFDHVSVLLAQSRKLSPSVSEMLSALISQGARVRTPKRGSADVCMLRNVLLSSELADENSRPVWLLLDDDIVATLDTLYRLCDFKPGDHPARSAVYCTADQRLAGHRLDRWLGDKWTRGAVNRWAFGMGCMAVTSDSMRKLADALERLTLGTDVVYPFCTSGPNLGKWMADDYSFCWRLGGVELRADCPAAHLKEMLLWPHESSLAMLAENGELEG